MINCKGTVEWGGRCRSCPEGGECPGGASLIPLKGKWVPPRPPYNSSSLDIPNPSLIDCHPEVCVYNTCRIHHTGVLLLLFINVISIFIDYA